MMQDSVPRKRWKLLSSVILPGRGAGPPQEPNFPDYGLIKLHKIREEARVDRYMVSVTDFPKISFQIDLIKKPFTLSDITGFNNTGNVRLWPSETILARYLLENPSLYKDKVVLELGGGMTSLAGLTISHSSHRPKSVLCTDGNVESVHNLSRMIHSMNKGQTLSARLLRWDDNEEKENDALYDLIVSADCLFFHAGRRDLASFIARKLKPEGGMAVIVSPLRGSTFKEFYKYLEEFPQLKISLHQNYSQKVTQFRTKVLEKDSRYVEDSHYPHLIICVKN